MQDKVIHDCAKRKVNKRVWSLPDYNEFFASRLLCIDEVFIAKFVSILNVIYCGYSHLVCFIYFTLSSLNCFS